MGTEPRSDVANRLGYWSALVAFVGGAGYDLAQVFQLVGVLTPPWDGILIYGFSFLIAVPFMVALIALHQGTPPERRVWSHVALLMSVVYVAYVSLNYTVQLAVVIPRLTSRPLSTFWTRLRIRYFGPSMRWATSS